MFKKIKFLFISFIILVFLFSIWHIDFNLNGYKQANAPRSFEQYRDANKEYKDLDIEYKNTSWTDFVKKGKIFLDKEKKELLLQAEYKIIEKTIPEKDKYIYYAKDFTKNLVAKSIWIEAISFTFFIIFLPIIFRFMMYFIIAPFVMRTNGIKLFENTIETSSINIINNEEKNLSVNIPPKESFIVVNEEHVSGIEENKNLKKSMKWLFSWTYPIMSFLNGLRTMNNYKNLSDQNIAIDLTSEDPDEYFMEIELKDCPSAFIFPSNIKAYSPEIKIKCKWKVFSWASLVLMQVRYYTISGTGKIILSARGGFAKRSLDKRNEQRRKIGSLVFSDSTLAIKISRTENWYNYIFGKTTLFDLLINGDGNFLIANAPYKKGILNSPSDHILTIIGKFFGF